MNIRVLLLCLCLSCTLFSIEAKNTKEAEKERKEALKSAERERDAKPSKLAKKEGKKLIKEGWCTPPGSMPLEKQLDKLYLMMYEYDNDDMPKYIFGEALSTGGNYDAANMQSMELAKLNIISQLQSEIISMVENVVANKQLSEAEAESVTQSIMSSRNIMAQRLGRVKVVLQLYRDLPNGGKEVMIKIAYDMDQARKIAKSVIEEQLEREGQGQINQLDELFGC